MLWTQWVPRAVSPEPLFSSSFSQESPQPEGEALRGPSGPGGGSALIRLVLNGSFWALNCVIWERLGTGLAGTSCRPGDKGLLEELGVGGRPSAGRAAGSGQSRDVSHGGESGGGAGRTGRGA